MTQSRTFTSLCVAGLILLGLLLRWIFGAAPTTEPVLLIAKALAYLSCDIEILVGKTFCEQGGWAEARALVGARALFPFLPTAILYALFGVNSVASSLYPLMLSLVIGLLYYRLALAWAGEASGLVALFLWALNPTEIFSAKLLSPDVLSIGFILGLLLLLTTKDVSKLLATLVAGAALLLFSDIASVVQVVLLYGALATLASGNARILWSFSAVVSFVLIFAIGGAGSWLSNYYDSIARPEAMLWLPLLFIAATYLVSEKEIAHWKQLLLFWLLSSFYLAMLSPLCPSSSQICALESAHQIAIQPAHGFILSPPMIIVIAIYLGEKSKKLNLQALFLAVPALITFVAIKTATVPQLLLWDYKRLLSLNPGNLMVYSQIFVAITLILGFAGIAINHKRPNWLRSSYLALLFASIGIASPNFLQRNSAESIFYFQALGLLNKEYQQQAVQVPIIVQDNADLLILELLNSFKRDNYRVFSEEEDYAQLTDAFVMLSPIAAKQPIPYNWAAIKIVKDGSGKTVSLYRTPSTSRSSLLTTYHQLINQERYCEAYAIWAKTPKDDNTPRFIEINPRAHCFPANKLSAIIQSDDLGMEHLVFRGVDTSLLWAAPTEDTVGYWATSNETPFYPDWRFYEIELTLQPDKLYLMSLEVRANTPVVSLYLSTNEEEWFIGQQRHPNWTRVEALYSTEGLSDNQLNAVFSPAMFAPYEAVFISSFSVEEVSE